NKKYFNNWRSLKDKILDYFKSPGGYDGSQQSSGSFDSQLDMMDIDMEKESNRLKEDMSILFDILPNFCKHFNFKDVSQILEEYYSNLEFEDVETKLKICESLALCQDFDINCECLELLKNLLDKSTNDDYCRQRIAEIVNMIG